MRSRIASEYCVEGRLVREITCYQYDWISETLGVVAFARSEEGKLIEVFTEAEHAKRIGAF